MSVDGGFGPNKRLTNHFTRKDLVQKLRDSSNAPTEIMQVKHPICNEIFRDVRRKTQTMFRNPTHCSPAK